MIPEAGYPTPGLSDSYLMPGLSRTISGHYPKSGYSRTVRMIPEAELLPDYPATLRSRAFPLSRDCGLSTKARTYLFDSYNTNVWTSSLRTHTGGPERMGPRPPPWVPLLKSYGSSILSTSLGSKTSNNTSSLGLG